MATVDAHSIPNEILVMVFEHLSPDDLFAASRVCGRWRTLIREKIYRRVLTDAGYWRTDGN